MTKYQLARKIEEHHLYQPRAEGVYSKRYRYYSSFREVELLMRLKKAELQDLYDNAYSEDGRELSAHEINW